MYAESKAIKDAIRSIRLTIFLKILGLKGHLREGKGNERDYMGLNYSGEK